jgi:N-acetyl-anhydromuramoyl-L-alanine amidase
MNLTLRRLTISKAGWCKQATHLRSPNCDSRADGERVTLLVLHNISLPPGEFGGSWISDLFLNQLDFGVHPYFDQLRNLRVSSHFLIRRNGELLQFVSVNDRAWHAGLSSFNGRERCNDFSVGVELEGTDDQSFTENQYTMLTSLTRALVASYPLTDVVGHEHIAPLRKTDPGPFFDWSRARLSVAEFAPALAFPEASYVR